MFALIDYASRRVWCWFCKHKDDAFHHIKHFLEIEVTRARAANRDLGTVTLVTDGGELHSIKAAKVCATYNVVQQFTCYNTPENNAIMERVWRTIAEMAIAMLVWTRVYLKPFGRRPGDTLYTFITECHRFASPPITGRGCALTISITVLIGLLVSNI